MSGGIRRAVVVGILAALAIPAGAASKSQPVAQVNESPRRIAAVDTLESQVLREINRVRRSRGLVALRSNARLGAAADSHSRAMGTRGFFSHDSADGSPFDRRVQRFYSPRGYAYWSVGENLLWSSPGVEADAAVQMWMDSPAHRKNLLTARWREVGLSAVHVKSAPGTFGGLDVTIVTANFGVRR